MGHVVSIHIAVDGARAMTSVDRVRAVPGKGLEGDRYYAGTGTWSKRPGPDREVTLIESEAIEAMARDYGIHIDPGDARRNIVTRGVALAHLVGKEFKVGEVKLKGLRLAEPCGHLESLSKPGVKEGLVHRGGLRAQVLEEGTIASGDPIEKTAS